MYVCICSENAKVYSIVNAWCTWSWIGVLSILELPANWFTKVIEYNHGPQFDFFFFSFAAFALCFLIAHVDGNFLVCAWLRSFTLSILWSVMIKFKDCILQVLGQAWFGTMLTFPVDQVLKAYKRLYLLEKCYYLLYNKISISNVWHRCCEIFFMQVHLSHDDINKVQLELVPMLQEIIFEWLIIIFFTITPSAPAVTEDFNSKLSSLQIGRFMMF